MNAPISIQTVILHRLVMQLKHPFTTNIGDFQKKDFFIVEVIDSNGLSGYGETAAFPSPWYTEETTMTTQHVMESFLIPLLMNKPITHPDQVSQRFQVVRRNNMAKAAIEGAVWDLYAKINDVPLAVAIGGTKQAVDVGVAIGVQASIPELLHLIDTYVAQGYKRVKLKIKPGWDVHVLKQVRQQFPNLAIMADANSAYTLKDIDLLKQIDDLDLLMIEQPLAHNDFLDHATLQRELSTPICLDESIHTFSDVRLAIELGSCKIISMKLARVGGITEAKKIHDYCQEHHVPVWCGGMLEAGVGRAHSLAIATLPQFQFPGDTSASSKYWEHDIIQPEVKMTDGQVRIPNQPGIGHDINWDAITRYRIDKKVIKN
ncbi:o-succinylbenzoate synthase [Aquibacillus rhizosphaerae]|uniref:o-succinylbenzoate synthase n=1 Tax=Aquibacillus rhizosphaerae TaxID=3051431 RepID=A0ABT7KZY8_9BACI|nr:o-succinylbenzoate synthase [Aquibacillus sp. LR5S19]MDL4839103.1 o-succinylbenzoate synthase [Aquibacillus sp. LR5S19]